MMKKLEEKEQHEVFILNCYSNCFNINNNDNNIY